MNATTKYSYHNIANAFNENQTERIMSPLILITCCIGLPLNGIVIWVLGFQIKRNPFTILILNLAVSDFGVLIFIPMFLIPYLTDFMPSSNYWTALSFVLTIMHINGLFLLTAISIDRCVAVLFPIWHRFSRPKYLSLVICGFLWTISVLLGGIQTILEFVFKYAVIPSLDLLVTALLCVPLITTSTVILLININLRPKLIKRRRLLVMILITLFCFLILSVPIYICIIMVPFLDMIYLWDDLQLSFYFNLSACLNSSVNPVIYFLVGRKKGARSRESIKMIFQRVFREDEAPETR